MKQRIESIDIIRGISIIGILFMNILGFHIYNVYLEPFKIYKDSMSQTLYQLNMLFVHNSFYPIFAFLFGLGLAIMYTNMKHKNIKPGIVLYRRIFFMMIFGFIHGMLLFNGDFLHLYATLAIVAIPFLFIRKRHALITSTILFGLNILVWISSIIWKEEINMDGLAQDSTAGLKSDIAHHDIAGIIQWNSDIFISEKYPHVFTWLLPNILMVFPFILFGIWFYKSDGINKIRHNIKRSTIIAILLAVIGFAIKAMGVYQYDVITTSQHIYIGGSLVAAAYFIAVVIMCEQPKLLNLLSPFKALGKLAFTNYIMQSVFMFIIFYGLGYYSKLTLLQITLIGVGIAITQVICSNIYLKYYKMGPLEYVWRKLTYLK
ncbi:DUF418 domain-containing protein [Macrococcus equi]|uniref:DUF418 domain-containing protein n=2 Tax=Macrococcus equi TaxID=3395462 RepID=UPI0039BE3127